MVQKLKTKILKLRELGKTYNEIVKELNCGKAIISYHCRMNGVGGNQMLLTDEERKVNNYKRVKSHRQKLKTKAIQYKGGACEKCGYNKCEWALDFHHLDANLKDFSISQYIKLSWDKVRNELDKCIILCANCHREIHYNNYINCDVTLMSDTHD